MFAEEINGSRNKIGSELVTGNNYSELQSTLATVDQNLLKLKLEAQTSREDEKRFPLPRKEYQKFDIEESLNLLDSLPKLTKDGKRFICHSDSTISVPA